MHTEHQASRRPYFLIAIDTEGDNLWAQPTTITTRNAGFLPRFQALCESYGLRPTYLTNYEMATSPAFVEFGRDVLHRGAGEIGMHLHAWNSPPILPLTADDFRYQPYLCEYPPEVIQRKVAYMTDLLEQTFAVKMKSHRAGRWGLNAAYAQALIAQGYRVDCSVTPHIDWRQTPGDPAQHGGPNFSAFPTSAYFLDPREISHPGDSPLLEVPMTIVPTGAPRAIVALTARLPKGSLPRRVLQRFWPATCWLQPIRWNRPHLLRLMARGIAEGWDYLQFTLHSSEFMPGGSPTFRTEDDIERLYETLDRLFALAQRACRAATLSEYHDAVLARESPCLT